MTTVTSVLGIVPGLQATALVANNLKLVPKNFGMKSKTKSKMIPLKKVIKVGVVNFVGIGLIKPTSQMINSL